MWAEGGDPASGDQGCKVAAAAAMQVEVEPLRWDSVLQVASPGEVVEAEVASS
jgi:hypothetical protein